MVSWGGGTRKNNPFLLKVLRFLVINKTVGAIFALLLVKLRHFTMSMQVDAVKYLWSIDVFLPKGVSDSVDFFSIQSPKLAH